jgi:hypothetical protein
MKKFTTILTALILMLTLTFTTGCKKDNGKNPINPIKTTTEIVIGNDWKFTNGTALRTNGTLDTNDTIVSFEPNYKLTITPVLIDFIHNNYTIKDDSVCATLVYRNGNYPDSLFYLTKINDNKDKLIGQKIKSTFVNNGSGIWQRDTTNIILDIIKK